jgi:hypothetical protein
MLTPACHASRWFMIFPVISGWALAQAAALALAVKKLMVPQQVSAAAGGPAAPAPGGHVPQAVSCWP